METKKNEPRKIRGSVKMLDKLDALPDISLRDLFEILNASRKKQKGNQRKLITNS